MCTRKSPIVDQDQGAAMEEYTTIDELSNIPQITSGKKKFKVKRKKDAKNDQSIVKEDGIHKSNPPENAYENMTCANNVETKVVERKDVKERKSVRTIGGGHVYDELDYELSPSPNYLAPTKPNPLDWGIWKHRIVMGIILCVLGILLGLVVYFGTASPASDENVRAKSKYHFFKLLSKKDCF